MTGGRICGNLFVVSFAVAVGGWLMAAAPSAEQPSIREILDADGHIVAVEAGPLSSIAVAPLNERTDANEAFARLLSVNVDAESAIHSAVRLSRRASLPCGAAP